ncbi:Imm42 family immunity protein [Rhizobium sp. NPDC090279]|uniref:Imm42 family immunity protein n=1 Tax=Rhizobium sp. NPDC090279 TaxID=3364499 RepID=UPI00383B07E3
MIIGDSDLFAIESEITTAFPSLSQLALGFFAIHIGGRAFGVRAPDASMLGCSFDEVNNRLRRRGTHFVAVLAAIEASDIMNAYLDAFYRDSSRIDYFGLSSEAFVEALLSNAVIWAPDGDEAFDDGSHILQFDIGGMVRLIAFVNEHTSRSGIGAISEKWLNADTFYQILARWSELFTAEWAKELERENSIR